MLLAGLVFIGSLITPVYALTLYVDIKTEQVYTTPGENRVKLGEFKQIDEEEDKLSSTEITDMKAELDKKTEEIKAIEQRLDEKQLAIKAEEQETLEEYPEKEASVKDKKWYDHIKIVGFTQLRINAGLSGDLENLSSSSDRSIEPGRGFFMRRARLKFLGNITDQLKLYMQVGFAGGDARIVDMYSDLYFDEKKEFRIRPGLSKIPASFELLQSSHDRTAIERADAIGSGIRDTGLFFYWAPDHIRKRFKYLSSNLKGSGDFGVIGLGLYTGQGSNRKDQNKNLHIAARVTYPFKFDNGQYFETGVYGYTGKIVPVVGTNAAAGINSAPVFDNKGLRDERIGLHAVLYPQPFGFQAEWNWGKSPKLSDDLTRIESASISGGYIKAMYAIENRWGKWFPYARWQKYNGAERFAVNSPFTKVRETEIGLEWQIKPQIELTAAYTNMERTNINTLRHVKNANIMRFQVQWDYF